MKKQIQVSTIMIALIFVVGCQNKQIHTTVMPAIQEQPNSTLEVMKETYSIENISGATPENYSPELIIKNSSGKELHRFTGLEAITTVQGITKDNSHFFKCQIDGHSQSSMQVYSLPDFSLIFENPFTNELLVECGSYDSIENSITFNTSSDWNKEQKIHKYSFKTNSLE